MVKRILLAAMLVSAALTLASSPAYSQAAGQATKEVTKQTTRQISQAIANRISQSQAATQKDEERGPNAWYTFSYNKITEDNAFSDLGLDFDVDLFQNLAGIDWEFEHFYLGISLAQAHADVDFSFAGTSIRVDTNDYTVSPYAAWIINDYFFANLLAGYTLDDPGNEKVAGMHLPDSHVGFYEIGLNGIWTNEHVEASAKTGYRYSIIAIDVPSSLGIDDLIETYTIFVGGEVGFPIGRFKPYIRGWYEGSIPETSIPGEGRMLHTGFVGGGVTFEVTENVALGLDAWTEVGNKFTNNTQGSATVRIRF